MAALARRLKHATDPRHVLVLNSDINAARLTYDGIDILGERLADLVRSAGDVLLDHSLLCQQLLRLASLICCSC